MSEREGDVLGNPYAPPSGNAPRPPAPAPHPPGPPSHPVPNPPGAPRPGEPDPAGRPVPLPDPQVVKAASRHVMTFGLLVLAGIVTNGLPLPFQAASLGFVLAAMVVGFRALRFVWRTGLRGIFVPMLAAGLAFTFLLSISMASLLLLWPVQLERQRCLAGAVTIAATQECQVDFQQKLENRLRELSGTSTGS